MHTGKERMDTQQSHGNPAKTDASCDLISKMFSYLKLITGHGVTPAGGSAGRTIGTRLTTEKASLRRAARLMNWDTFCRG